MSSLEDALAAYIQAGFPNYNLWSEDERGKLRQDFRAGYEAGSRSSDSRPS